MGSGAYMDTMRNGRFTADCYFPKVIHIHMFAYTGPIADFEIPGNVNYAGIVNMYIFPHLRPKESQQEPTPAEKCSGTERKKRSNKTPQQASDNILARIFAGRSVFFDIEIIGHHHSITTHCGCKPPFTTHSYTLHI